MDKKVHLSKRLEMIASICQPVTVLADVGCDHAYLSIALVQRGIAKQSIAMDLRKGPLAKAEENVNKYGLGKSIELRLGDGLEKLNSFEADEILISGMGGILTCNILEAGFNKLKPETVLVLQPQSDLSLVRHFLHDKGMKIVNELTCFEDGKFYNCMLAVFGKESYDNEYEYELGKVLIDRGDKVLKEFILHRIHKTGLVIEGVKANGGNNKDEVLSRFLNEYDMLNEALAAIDA